MDLCPVNCQGPSQPPSHAQAWSTTPTPTPVVVSVCAPTKVFERGLSPSWLVVVSLMLLPPQCGFTPGGLASQLPPLSERPQPLRLPLPQGKERPPLQPPSHSLQLGGSRVLAPHLFPDRPTILSTRRTAASAFGQKALALWQPLASTWNVPGPQTASAQGAILPLAVARGPALLLPWALVSSPSRCFQGPPGSTHPSQLPPLAGRSHHCPPEPLWGPCWLSRSLKKQLANRAPRALGTSP